MKRMKKIVLALLTCVLVIASATLAFADEKTYLGLTADNYNNLISSVEQNFLTPTYEKVKFMEQNSTGYQKDAYESICKLKETLGDYQKTDSSKTTFKEVSKNEVQVTFESLFKDKQGKNDVTILSTVTCVLYDGDTSPTITAIDFSQKAENDSLGKKMGDAAINTLIGMGTVFIILIFISFIISLLKYVPALLQKKEKTTAQPEAELPQASPAAEEVAVDTAAEEEIAAAIAAAIAASEETSTDGYVVRSIRKRR